MIFIGLSSDSCLVQNQGGMGGRGEEAEGKFNCHMSAGWVLKDLMNVGRFEKISSCKQMSSYFLLYTNPIPLTTHTHTPPSPNSSVLKINMLSLNPKTCLPLILLLRVKLSLVTDYRKLLISRNVESLLQTMASILVSGTSALMRATSERFEGIRNGGEEGRTVHSSTLPVTCAHTHSPSQKPHHMTQIHWGF